MTIKAASPQPAELDTVDRLALRIALLKVARNPYSLGAKELAALAERAADAVVA